MKHNEQLRFPVCSFQTDQDWLAGQQTRGQDGGSSQHIIGAYTDLHTCNNGAVKSSCETIWVYLSMAPQWRSKRDMAEKNPTITTPAKQ